MRYLFILLIAFVFIRCEPIVNVSAENNYRSAVSGFIKTSIIPDFEHQYDSVKLTVTNNSNSIQYFYSGPSPAMTISLSVGSYNMHMGTPDPDPISYYLAFSASSNSVAIQMGTNNIMLGSVSKQALVLIDSTSVDGVPMIAVGSESGLMSTYGKYYYSYVLGRCLVSYSIDSQSVEMPITTLPEKIYIFSASIGNINIIDQFIEIIRI